MRGTVGEAELLEDQTIGGGVCGHVPSVRFCDGSRMTVPSSRWLGSEAVSSRDADGEGRVDAEVLHPGAAIDHAAEWHDEGARTRALQAERERRGRTGGDDLLALNGHAVGGRPTARKCRVRGVV